jgi:hypothetical protein
LTVARPFEPRVVASLPAVAAAAPREWAAAMSVAGVDALALDGDPGDPLVRAVLAALRGASDLPLELHCPPGEAAPPSGPLPDWLVPDAAADPAVEAAWVASGVGVARPLAAVDADTVRVHVAAVEAPEWAGAPPAAERSWRPGPQAAPGPWAGADTLVLHGELLAGTDPGAAVARWREHAG